MIEWRRTQEAKDEEVRARAKHINRGSEPRPTHIPRMEVLKATTFAASAHKTQVRKNAARTPYINHPVQVAFLLASSLPNAPIEVLQAALLHDTVEDTLVTLDNIEREFGPRVRRIVDEVSDDKALNSAARKQVRTAREPEARSGLILRPVATGAGRSRTPHLGRCE